MLERRDGTYALRNALRVKLHLRLLIDEDVAAANLRLQRLDFLAEFAIRAEEVAANGTIRTRTVATATFTRRAAMSRTFATQTTLISPNQRLTNEYLSRFNWRDRAVVHASMRRK